MSREWKPGDVAMTAHNTVALCHAGKQFLDVNGAPWSDDKFPTNLRPLVVIDPEDAEAVERLRLTVGGQRGCLAINRTEEMQAALREFADPKPRIEEPPGLGAVVRDADDDVWIRNNPYDDCKWRSPDGTWVAWADIDAVEILAEGWFG